MNYPKTCSKIFRKVVFSIITSKVLMFFFLISMTLPIINVIKNVCALKQDYPVKYSSWFCYIKKIQVKFDLLGFLSITNKFYRVDNHLHISYKLYLNYNHVILIVTTIIILKFIPITHFVLFT